LFDYLNSKKSLENSEIIAYLSKRQKDKKVFSSSYLSVVKTYLKNRILESLRLQYINKRRNYELLSKSMNADILLEKGLYPLAENEIETSIQKNLGSSFPIERLLMLRRKSILNYFQNYSSTNIEGINSLYQKRMDALEQLAMEIKFARILSVMSFQYFNGQNDPELLKSFMEEPYMQDESLSTDFSTKYLFHWVHAQFQEFQNENEKALTHFNKSIAIWIKSPQYIDAHPRMYLGACFTYFKYLIHQKEPFSNILSDINFNVLMSKVKQGNLHDEEKVTHRLLFILFEVLALRQQGDAVKIIELISPLTEKEDNLKEIPDYENVIFCYYAAWAYFEIGNFKRARDILVDLLNPLDQRLACNPIYISVYILLYIITLYECENFKLLRNLLPKLKNFLEKEGRLTTFESLFISMVSQLMSPRFENLKDLVYKRFYDRLLIAHEKDDRGIRLEYDFLLSWVKIKEMELD
jgi:hypothetical protein